MIHIGDLEHTDIAGIDNFGGISIKFTGAGDIPGSPSHADFQIDSYSLLPSLIEEILAKSALQ